MSDGHTALTRTLSLAVHEFRTPVTVVAGYLRMLLREQAGPLNDKQRKMLEEAERSCTRFASLVSEMSELEKLTAGEVTLGREHFDLGQLLEELASDVHEGIDRDVHLEVRGTDATAMVNADRKRVASALRALVTSALRERAGPSVVVAECSRVSGAPGWAVVAIGDHTVLAALTDHATATPPAFDEWRGGLGLGLLIARRVIEAHGGAVWSADNPQSRAAVALRLPLQL